MYGGTAGTAARDVTSPAANKHPSLFQTLGETEELLQEALKAASHLSDKLVGPRPAETPKIAESANSLEARVRTLRDRAQELVVELSAQHRALGDLS